MSIKHIAKLTELNELRLNNMTTTTNQDIGEPEFWIQRIASNLLLDIRDAYHPTEDILNNFSDEYLRKMRAWEVDQLFKLLPAWIVEYLKEHYPQYAQSYERETE